jgi:hypothetical protein
LVVRTNARTLGKTITWGGIDASFDFNDGRYVRRSDDRHR